MERSMASFTRRRFVVGSSATFGLAISCPAFSAGSAEAEKTSSAKVRRTVLVGATRTIRTLREAADVARDGDLVLVDPGEYRSDVSVWSQRELIIRGNGPGAVLIADSASAEDKGTFVFRNAQALVENLAFRGARARDQNGAGIRLDTGSRLTVSRCRFEDNENGILTSNDVESELTVLDSAFMQNGAGDGQTHNLYAGAIARLTVTGCYFARARVGHLLKTRARESFIHYSRLSGEDGTSSYELEFPSGGRAEVLGCLIQQGPNSDNATIVSFGAEGYRWQQNELLVSFSTIVNDRPRGSTFFRVPAGPARVELLDNLLLGPGEMDVRATSATVQSKQANRADFADVTRLDYRLRQSSKLVGAAGLSGALGSGRLHPEREYVHPSSTAALEKYSPLTALSPGAFQRLAP